jgi:hypothetical protein
VKNEKGKLESSKKIWSERLLSDLSKFAVLEAILLVTASTGDAWFQPLWDFPICFPRRIKFWGPNAGAGNTGGSAIVYMGPNIGKFFHVFSEIGHVAYGGDDVGRVIMARRTAKEPCTEMDK